MWKFEADVGPVGTWPFSTFKSSIGCSSQKPTRPLSDLCQVHFHLSSQYTRIQNLSLSPLLSSQFRSLSLPVQKSHKWPPSLYFPLF